MMPSLRSVAATAVLIVALCWPAILNGQPFFLLDTIYYLNSAGRGAEKLIGVQTPWYPAKFILAAPSELSPANTASGPTQPPSVGAQTQTSESPQSAVLIARSVYYGAFLLISDSLQSLWLAVLAQAALIAKCTYLTLRQPFKEPRSATLVSLIAVAIFTPLPFFVTTQRSGPTGRTSKHSRRTALAQPRACGASQGQRSQTGRGMPT